MAQSLFHDHAPAREIGISTMWVNRPSKCPGVGVALPTDVTPDHEVPDMVSLAELAGV